MFVLLVLLGLAPQRCHIHPRREMQIGRQNGANLFAAFARHHERHLNRLDVMVGVADVLRIGVVLASRQGQVLGITVLVDRPLCQGVAGSSDKVILGGGFAMAMLRCLRRQRPALVTDAAHLARQIGHAPNAGAHRHDIAPTGHARRIEHLLRHRPVKIRTAKTDQTVIHPALFLHSPGT